MSRDLTCARFVCYDDISEGIVYGLNPVMYNPALQDDERRYLLSKLTFERFGVKLSDEQLDSLCKHDKYHLTEFVKEMKEYIYFC